MAIERFEQLEVWQEAHRLVLATYEMTRRFPSDERFGIVSQIRRAAVSVPANIVEGFKRRGQRDKMNFYNIAQASLEEVRYYLILSRDLGFVQDGQVLLERTERVGRMLTALIRSIRDSV